MSPKPRRRQRSPNWKRAKSPRRRPQNRRLRNGSKFGGRRRGRAANIITITIAATGPRKGSDASSGEPRNPLRGKSGAAGRGLSRHPKMRRRRPPPPPNPAKRLRLRLPRRRGSHDATNRIATAKATVGRRRPKAVDATATSGATIAEQRGMETARRAMNRARSRSIRTRLSPSLRRSSRCLKGRTKKSSGKKTAPGRRWRLGLQGKHR